MLTSLTTLLVVGVLYAFGGAGVHGFSFALLIGVVVGTYSSVGIATPLLFRPQLCKAVVAVIVALTLIGVTFLATDNTIVELVVIGIIVVASVWLIVRIKGAPAYAPAGRPAAA